MELGTKLTVYADESYSYEAKVSESELMLTYCEEDREESYISFGSLDEMESVARAMLLAVSTAREAAKLSKE
jgi:hypothetical protein